ncbi:MAG: hypothetical protein ACRDQH_09610 [Pseudonocardiaceae bacterium]
MIPLATVTPVAPITTVVAVVMASAKTAKVEEFRDPHIVVSCGFLGLEPIRRVRGLVMLDWRLCERADPSLPSWPSGPF